MILLHVFASTGMGLLIGVLLGLSTSPVVGLIVGAAASLLASLLGLAGGKETAPAESSLLKIQACIRAGVFGFACLAGVFGGIYVRTHNLLSPPDHRLEDYYSQLRMIGFSPAEARRLAVNLPTSGAKSARENNAADSVLFSANIAECEKISAQNFTNTQTFINYLDNADLQKYIPIAQAIDNSQLNEQQKMDIMTKVMESLCVQH